jgi:hypothetical protein
MLEDLFEGVSITQVLLVAFGCFVLLQAINIVQENAKIKRVGGRAPTSTCGLQHAYGSVKSILNYSSLEYFEQG